MNPAPDRQSAATNRRRGRSRVLSQGVMIEPSTMQPPKPAIIAPMMAAHVV